VVRCRHCGHFQKLADEGELPSCTCEACGRPCRSRPREAQLESCQPEEISKETL